MELDEVKERYKITPLWGRIVLCIILGVLPATYYYFESGEYLLEDLANAKNGRDGARSQFEMARNKKGNLPKLEEAMAFTEQQLQEARKQLPDTFFVEDLLQKLATLASEAGVTLNDLVPDAKPVPSDGEFRYMELGHKTSVTGKYNNVANFLDKVAHLESSIFIKEIVLTRSTTIPEEILTNAPTEQATPTPESKSNADHQLALDNRKFTEVKADLRLVAYRSMTEGEGGFGMDGGLTPGTEAVPAGDPQEQE